MPPIKKFSKERILDTAYSLARKEGLESINARKIASILGCSVQPIFHNFKNMEEVKQEVFKKIYALYQEYMIKGSKEEKGYKGMGLAYIKYAKDYPEFFKIIFMQETPLNAEDFIVSDSAGNNVIEMGMKLTGLSFEEQKKFHVKVWIFTHGIACLVATGTIKISDSEIENLLESTVRQMVIGYLKEKNNEKNNWSKKLNERI